MEFFKEKIRFDPAAKGPNGEDTDREFFKMIGQFELTLEDVREIITGLNWIISRTPKGDEQTDSDRFVLSVVRPMKQKMIEASLLMRKELGMNV